ncbi:uncharacterized protein LOC143446010 [Clavelina lepadiformis]|uniref:ZP domain-containing protein n=1 Tax=Clavelina lepadiformis TaxID=159417 RepID=A0ABP0GTL7_CLALP
MMMKIPVLLLLSFFVVSVVDSTSRGVRQVIPGSPTCANVICPTGRRCVQGACVCNQGYEGAGCKSPVTTPATPSVCTSTSCLNGCQCVPSCRHSDGYYCVSSAGFIGKYCNIPVPDLVCASDRIEVKVSQSFVQDLQISGNGIYLFLASNYIPGSVVQDACKATLPTSGVYAFTVPLPFSLCGLRRTTDPSGKIVVSGEVWFNLVRSLYDMPLPVLRFSCVYASEYNVVTSLQPTIDTVRASYEGEILMNTAVQLCKTPSCPSDCPQLFSVNQGAVYTVSEMIHVSMSVNFATPQPFAANAPNPNDMAIVKQMYLSCSSTPGQQDILLIDNGCESTLLRSRITRESVDRTVCVSFRVPRMFNCSVMYIHAKLNLVPKNSLTPCPYGNGYYSPSLGRRRRASGLRFPENSTTSVKIGPIFILEGSRGSPLSEVFPQNNTMVLRDAVYPSRLTTPPSRQESLTEHYGVVAASIVGVLALVVLVLFVAFISRSGYRTPKM